jgi:hypothetical protein
VAGFITASSSASRALVRAPFASRLSDLASQGIASGLTAGAASVRIRRAPKDARRGPIRDLHKPGRRHTLNADYSIGLEGTEAVDAAVRAEDVRNFVCGA